MRRGGIRKKRKSTKETVRKRFLMTRYLEDYFDLFCSFETIYRLEAKG
jgi:hypothetical protein